MNRSASPRSRSVQLLATALLTALLACLACLHHAAPAHASGAVHLNANELATLKKLNAYRVAHHRRPLRIDTRLQRTADWMANDLQTHDYFGHTDSKGRSPFQRMAHFRYPSNTWRGENLNSGFRTAQASFTAWRHSPPHDRNQLDGHFRRVGIAVITGTVNGQFKSSWVVEFGS
jgi:uncharacterized protein YkwD